MQRSALIFTFAAALCCVATDSAFGQAGVTNELQKLTAGEQVSPTVTEPVTAPECVFDYECFPRPNVCYTPICCTQSRVDQGYCAADEIGACTAIYRLYGDIDENGVGPKVFDIFCVLDIIAGDEGRCTFEQTDIVGNAGSPCTPNGVVNVFEALACLEALEGTDPCCSGAACCSGELLDTCSYEWPWTCIDLDGLYLPDVKSCTPDPCGGPAPAAIRVVPSAQGR